MKTVLTDNVNTAAKIIINSGIVAFPTETVYGLGANVFDVKALNKIFKVKGREKDNPLIVHISSKSQLDFLSSEISSSAKKLINAFFPGALTIILQRNELIPGLVTANLNTVAVRMPSSKAARSFIQRCGVPIAAPSANISGSPSPTTYKHVLEDFNGKTLCILKGPDSKYGIESTVVDCSVEIPVVLRPGAITIEELKKVIPGIKYRKKHQVVKSPGLKYKHYSPKAKIQIIKTPDEIKSKVYKTAYIGLGKTGKDKMKLLSRIQICNNVGQYAKKLFWFFRICDNEKIDLIYVQKIPESGIGLAIMNRVKKALK